MSTKIFAAYNIVTNYMWNLVNMLKRRTSKRFVIGDSNEVQNFDDEEPMEVIPSSLVQKFQMTLDAEPDDNVGNEEAVKEEDGKLLQPPKTATLQ